MQRNLLFQADVSSFRLIMEKEKKIAVIGSGLIGRCWAIIFAKAGYSVCLYDVNKAQITNALDTCRTQLSQMETDGFFKESSLNAEEIFRLISGSANLMDALKDAIYVQECTPENIDMKKQVFAELSKHADEGTIIASSTSCLVPSLFTEKLPNRSHCLVAHPVNPPHLVPLVELVPSPWTDPEVVERTKDLMKDIGQTPVIAKKEVNGFILNRLQYALLMEAWRLVEDGVCSPEDVDLTVSKGLGLRYAVMGPFETMHLNAAGVKDYCERYGSNIERICREEGGPRTMAGQTAEKIHEAMCNIVPVDKLEERREWRDSKLGELFKLGHSKH
ncbi:lambda-crystallin-like [Rhopilema esculentum]|uniref:lambda-crystallin-like n=1 Tax=Rhopilema esculentum TaxID=499914 RepID=UPI0031D280AB